MKVKFMYLLSMVMLTSTIAKSQLVVAAPDVVTAVSANTSMQEATKTLASNTLSQTKEIVTSGKKLLEETQKYYDALKKVNSFISNSQTVKDIFSEQKQIVSMYVNYRYAFNDVMTINDQKEFGITMGNGLYKSTKILNDAMLLTKEDFYKMSDSERYESLNKIYQDMKKLRMGMSSYLKMSSLYSDELRRKKF